MLHKKYPILEEGAEMVNENKDSREPVLVRNSKPN